MNYLYELIKVMLILWDRKLRLQNLFFIGLFGYKRNFMQKVTSKGKKCCKSLLSDMKFNIVSASEIIHYRKLRILNSVSVCTTTCFMHPFKLNSSFLLLSIKS